MPSDSESLPPAANSVATARFHRNGATAFNLALRLTGSPGAAWYATIAAFAAVTERVPADAAPGVDDQDVVLMACWHARQLLSQVEGDPGYAEQLRAHDAAQRAGQPADPPVAGANAALPIDQRELLAMNGLGGLDHATLAALLRVDPGLLAVMVADARIQLHDLLHGTELAAATDDRQALALAGLRHDGELHGHDAQARLEQWIAADPTHAQTVRALEQAGDAYRAWPLTPPPAGLREAAIAAAVAVPNPAPLLGAAAPTPVESLEAGEHDRPLAAGSAATDEDDADRGGADLGATAEWSASDVAALGLEGAPIRAGAPPRAEPVVAEERGWASDEDFEPVAESEPPRDRAPRWHIALVAVLLVAVIVVLILTFTSKDEPTTPMTPGTTTTTRSAVAVPTPEATATVAVAIRIGGA